MTRPGSVDFAVVTVAVLIGVAIGYIDSRPSWDDTGVTVVALGLSAGSLSLVRPKLWWICALVVGLPVPAFNFMHTGSLQSFVAVAVALVAAAIGGGVGKGLGLSHPPAPR